MASRLDLCFALAMEIMDRLGGAVAVRDEVHGFQYPDARDLLGFVDGTENPTGAAASAAVLIGDEDADFTGGSYALVQKYVHDLKAWNALPVEAQERIIGRRKLDGFELDDGRYPPCREAGPRGSSRGPSGRRFSLGRSARRRTGPPARRCR